METWFAPPGVRKRTRDVKNDRPLQSAIRKNRVLTVFQEPTSTRKPFGQIGYYQSDFAIYLLFPQPLPRSVESRVIGINLDLLDEPVSVRPASKGASPPSRRPGAITTQLI